MASVVTDVAWYNIPKPEIEYYLVIGGHIPEVGLMLSFRRVGRRKLQRQGRKIVKCPHCSETLTETDIDTKVDIYHRPVSLATACHFHMKCGSCNKEVGLSIIHST